MKTKIEIIQETAAFYNAGNRGISGQDCLYETDDGKYCAVGRCIDPEKIDRKELGCNVGCLSSGRYQKTVILEDILLPDYKGHEIPFWSSLQWFHDKLENWTPTGLSEEGGKIFKKLLKQYEAAAL